MPFCTECGARHDDSARVCPNCGQPIFAPIDEEFDDVLPSFDQSGAGPHAAAPADDYLEQIQDVRAAIAKQSSALSRITDLTWSNPTATQIRDELTVALARLRELLPPPELGGAHDDFVIGAEHLVHGFVALVDALNRPNAESEVEAAQAEITRATERFRRGAEALNDFLVVHEGQSVPPLDGPDDAEPDDPLDRPDELLEPTVAADEAPTTAEGTGASRATRLERSTPAPTWSGPLDPGGSPTPLDADSAATSDAAELGAWPTLGDAATDSLLLEIEGGWVRGRPNVHEAIERAVRGAVADALRGALQTRRRIEEEARATLQRLASERNRLLDEVESLRRESLQLQTEAAELRRTLNELERERQGANDRRQQVFQEAETHRSQLLGEIEQLGGQLDAMRRNIVGLLNMSAQATGDLGPAVSLGSAGSANAPGPGGLAGAAAGPANRAAVRPPGPSRAAAPPAPQPRAPQPPPSASEHENTTQVRITGLQGVAKSLQLQKAIRALAGVEVQGQPLIGDGLLVLTLRHDPDVDLMGALLDLPVGGLQFEGMPEPGVIEFQAA
jgi:hypothetical protein